MNGNLVLRLAVLITFTSYLSAGDDPGHRILADSQMSRIAGLDADKHDYTSNCAYPTIAGTGAVAWRDCNGVTAGTPCVFCSGSNFTSYQSTGNGAKVRPQGAAMRCDNVVYLKVVGECYNGECINQGTGIAGGCSGSPSIYEPQPIDP